MIQGEKSTSMGSYQLPITDVDEKRRNFSGYQVNQYFNLADIQQGDTSGTTDTDSVTDTETNDRGGDGYTRINRTSGKQFKRK